MRREAHHPASEQQEAGEVKQKGIEKLKESLLHTIIGSIDNAELAISRIEEKKKKNEQVHFDKHSMPDTLEVAKAFFALKGLQEAGIISEAEISPLAQKFKEIMDYEAGRLEERADLMISSTAFNDRLSKEEHKQEFLQGEDNLVTKDMHDFFQGRQ